MLGRRDAATVRRLWQALPARYRRHYSYFIGRLPAYTPSLPTGPHLPCPKAEGETNIDEVLSCSLRQRYGVLVRKSCSFSKSLPTHANRIKTCIDEHNYQPMLT